MEALTLAIKWINGVVWGAPMLILIALTGAFLMAGLALMPLRKIGFAFKTLYAGRETKEAGDISPFNALMTALSATVGTGNIAGVATAIVLGGPGALFYMWVIALVGMATKYAEAVCAVKYRTVDSHGNHIGGPMYYIKNGVGEKFPAIAAVLAPAFAIFAAIAAFGIGNGVQINSIAAALDSNFGVPKLLTGIVIAALVAGVLLGGVKRIANVAGMLVPFMIFAYLGAGIIALLINVSEIPAAFALIFREAFEPAAAGGGIMGAGVAAAIRFGVARGVFSNEAGLGSAAIAHAAASTNNPVKQGHVAMLGTFIDTIIVCSITGLVILTTAGYTSGETGAVLTGVSFGKAIGGGNYIVAIALVIFAFTTILGWSYYGEKSVQYLFGDKANTFYKILWVLALPIGATVNLEFVWLLADTLNAMMALPNLIGLIILGPMVFRMTKEYWNGDGK
ncbi:MAG: sodium:alanine symporter family protein [Pseudomonadota bacterium]